VPSGERAGSTLFRDLDQDALTSIGIDLGAT
jgi:hypothetical protein